MTDEHDVENDESLLKRKAIRDLMFDKLLAPAERTKQIQLIMSGKIKPWATQSGAAPSAASPQSMPPFKSSETTGGGNRMGGGIKPPPPAFVPANTHEDKLRAKMDEANNNRLHSSSISSTGSGAMDDFEARLRNKSAGGDTKPSAVAQSSQFDDRLRSKLANSTDEPLSGIRRSSNESTGSGAMDDFEARIRNEAVGGDTKPSAVSQSSQFDDRLRSKLSNSNIQSPSVVGGNRRSSYESTGSAVEVSTIGGDDSTVEVGTIDGEDSTVDFGTVGDESDLSSLDSKSLTSRNWAKNRFRAAALEAKIAAKMSKAGGATDDNTELKDDEQGESVCEESDGEYTFETASCFTLELNEQEEPSSSQGVGYGSLPMPEENFRGDEVPMSNRESTISLVEDSSDIEMLRNSVAPSFSLRGEEEPNNVPNSSNPDGLAVATAIAPDDEPDYVFQGKKGWQHLLVRLFHCLVNSPPPTFPFNSSPSTAIEYDPDAKPPLHKNRRFRVYTYFALFLIVIVVALVVVYITSVSKEAEIKDTVVRLTSQPTPKATSPPTTFREAQGLIEQLQEGVLLRDEHFEAMQITDPRRLALDWILHHDDQRLVSDSVNLYQRYGLAVLAYAMDSKAWKFCGNLGENFTETSCSVTYAINQTLEFPKGVWLSGESECDWFGVTCSNDGIVRSVELISNNLVGVLPHELSGEQRSQIEKYHFIFVPTC